MSLFNLNPGTPIGQLTDQALDAGQRAVALDDQEPWGTLCSASAMRAAGAPSRPRAICTRRSS